MNEETVMAQPKVETIDGIEKYKVENAADTLIRAEEIKQDSKLLKAARGLINKKLIAAQQAKAQATQMAGKTK